MKQLAWLDVRDAIAIHAEQVAEYGGSGGIRDQNLLESAINRPLQLQAYAEPSLFELAAAYAFGIARNHPFIDGNKRTALVVSFTFLEISGWEINTSEEQAVITFMDLAGGDIDEPTLALWFQENSMRVSQSENGGEGNK